MKNCSCSYFFYYIQAVKKTEIWTLGIVSAKYCTIFIGAVTLVRVNSHVPPRASAKTGFLLEDLGGGARG